MIDWTKYPNFKSSEFDSKSSDGVDTGELMQECLLDKLQIARNRYNKPMRIISGYRTASHNKAVKGKPNSAHLRGYAVDISCTSSRQRLEMVMVLLLAGFERIGIGKTFIHVDCDPSLPEKVMFLY